jgi:hypothetical protein
MEIGPMSDRWQKRKYNAETASIIRKAKKDMTDWIAGLGYSPSEHDLRVWQAGYIYGINRGVNASSNNN